jgi:tetratricopeptide (TPR) repeat protein
MTRWPAALTLALLLGGLHLTRVPPPPEPPLERALRALGGSRPAGAVAAVLPPDTARALRAGWEAIEAQRYEDAQQAFVEARDRSPDAGEAWVGLGASWLALGLREKGVDAVERAVALAPACARAWRERAAIRYAKGDFEGAVADLRHAVALAPRDPVAWKMLGIQFRVLGRWRETALAFGAARSLDPSDTQTRMLLAEAEELLGNLAAAGGALEELVRERPFDASALFALAAFRERRQDWAGAIDAYERALRIGAPQPAVLEHLASLAENQLRDATLAGFYLERTVAAAREEPWALERQADFLVRRGEAERARVIVRRLLQGAGDRSVYYLDKYRALIR